MGDNFEKLRFVFENDALRLKMREHFVLRIIENGIYLYLKSKIVTFFKAHIFHIFRQSYSSPKIREI